MDSELQGEGVNATPIIELSFWHQWQAEILPGRPLILPPRHFVYPREAEEVERGALEILVRPSATQMARPPSTQHEPESFVSGHEFSRADSRPTRSGASAPEGTASAIKEQPFLATCALGFRDAAVPTGIWACPDPKEMCAVSGGYAYILDTSAPERFTMIPYRPVLEVRAAVEAGLLLFVGHHSILAWGAGSRSWESEKLSDEGVTITAIRSGQLHGTGWKMITDKEMPFALDLRSGLRF